MNILRLNRRTLINLSLPVEFVVMTSFEIGIKIPLK